MEGLTMTEPSSTQSIETHPIRGALWGLLLGLGLATYLILFKIIAIGLVVPVAVIVFTVAIGAAWGRFAPPRATH